MLVKFLKTYVLAVISIFIFSSNAMLQYELDQNLLYAALNSSEPDMIDALTQGANPAKVLPIITKLPLFNSKFINVVIENIPDKLDDFDFENGHISLLMTAAMVGNEYAVDKLLEAGVAVDIQDKNGWTALFYAICNMHLKIISKLIQRDASTVITNCKGETPITYALQLLKQKQSKEDRKKMKIILSVLNLDSIF